VVFEEIDEDARRVDVGARLAEVEGERRPEVEGRRRRSTGPGVPAVLNRAKFDGAALVTRRPRLAPGVASREHLERRSGAAIEVAPEADALGHRRERDQP